MTQGAVTKDSVVAVSKEQVSCDLSEEVAILDLRSGQYYGLTPVGGRIWNLIQEPKSVAEVLDILLSEYEVESDCCERDLLSLLEKLKAKGLIEVEDGKPE